MNRIVESLYRTQDIELREDIGDEKKFNSLSKKCQKEVERIYYDGYWNIVLKNYDRVISGETWGEVKWMLQQMVKENDFTLEW